MMQQANAVDVTAAGILKDLELDFKLVVVAAPARAQRDRAANRRLDPRRRPGRDSR